MGFQSSGYEIHGVRSQDMRKFNMNGSTILMLIAMFILSALVGIVIIGSKEVEVLGMMSLVVLVIVVVSMLYTLMIRSMIVLDVNFRVWMSLLIFGVLLGVFYGNSM